jgi:TetR/AcrR family transcriptional repressor of nem operon
MNRTKSVVPKAEMREVLLSTARAAVQAHGYNALSFRELAKAVGIKSASVHYHFPTKGDLGAVLARRYTQDGAAALEDLLTRSQKPTWCMDRYIEIFRAALMNGNRMCLCGIMGAEYDDLPEAVRAEIDAFARVNIAWLERVLALAHPKRDKRALQEQAAAIYAAIEGAQLIARSRGDITAYDQAVRAYRATGLIP